MNELSWRVTAAIIGVLLVGTACASPGSAWAQTDLCPEPNDAPESACPLGAGSAVESFVERAGDVDLYRLEVGEASRVQVELTRLPADYDLYLTNADGGVIGRSFQKGTADERLQLIVLAGTYYVRVAANPSGEPDAARPYSVGVVLGSSEGAERPPEPRPTDPAAPPTVPYGGQWVNLEILDGRVHFAARAYPGEGGGESVRVVNFRFRRPDGRWDTGCHADAPAGDLYGCSMNLNRVPEGEIKFGFDVHGSDVKEQGDAVTESPDGFRYLFVDR